MEWGYVDVKQEAAQRATGCSVPRSKTSSNGAKVWTCNGFVPVTYLIAPP